MTYVGTIVFYEYPNGVLTFQEAGVATGTIGPSKMGTACLSEEEPGSLGAWWRGTAIIPMGLGDWQVCVDR